VGHDKEEREREGEREMWIYVYMCIQGRRETYIEKDITTLCTTVNTEPQFRSRRQRIVPLLWHSDGGEVFNGRSYVIYHLTSAFSHAVNPMDSKFYLGMLEELKSCPMVGSKQNETDLIYVYTHIIIQIPSKRYCTYISIYTYMCFVLDRCTL